ncbi:MAG: hypothetical protein C0407_01460 [Desulfobacca sp.]|nr:hypothetical protein [Desulfobacca sp.]
MSSKLKQKLLINLFLIAMIFISVLASYARSINYTYDDMNRLIEVLYGDGSRIQYTYDAKGNRVSKTIQAETTPPTTTATPAGGLYNSSQSVTLSCNDGTGSGCDKIYYTTNGTTPTISSPVYYTPITISAPTTLKYFSRDIAGNNETVKSQTYTILNTIVTVHLKDSNGNPLSGGVVQYYSGSWKDFGTTDANGQVSKELKIGSYSFSMTYAYGRQEKAQNIGNDPNVIFQTKAVSIQLKDSTGAFLDTGTVQYYAGGWRDVGSTSGGQITKELLPGSYSFSMTYAYGRQEKSQNIGNDPNVVFQTKAVSIQLKDSTGAFLDTGTVQYYAGGWRDIGNTSGGQITKELLPGSYSFSMTYAYGRQEKAQNIGNDPIVIFQTKAVTIQLKESTGVLLDTGTVQYYAGGWRDIGTTSGGQITKELLPGSYSFSMTYAYGRQEKSQNIGNDPVVVFQTKAVTIQLKDSTGALIDTGTVQYYAGGWRDIGSTSGGQITKELLSGTYTFAMTYAYGRQEKSQNIGSDPVVVFQTKAVSIQLKDSTGALMDTGTVQYYAGGWRDIGSTTGGQITKELLPGSYSFSMIYAYGRQEKAQNIGNDPIVVFITGQIHSDSNSCINYYAGGWHLFSQNMELLQATYTFRFNDGTPDKPYPIISAVVNQIH